MLDLSGLERCLDSEVLSGKVPLYTNFMQQVLDLPNLHNVTIKWQQNHQATRSQDSQRQLLFLRYCIAENVCMVLNYLVCTLCIQLLIKT